MRATRSQLRNAGFEVYEGHHTRFKLLERAGVRTPLPGPGRPRFSVGDAAYVLWDSTTTELYRADWLRGRDPIDVILVLIEHAVLLAESGVLVADPSLYTMLTNNALEQVP